MKKNHKSAQAQLEQNKMPWSISNVCYKLGNGKSYTHVQNLPFLPWGYPNLDILGRKGRRMLTGFRSNYWSQNVLMAPCFRHFENKSKTALTAIKDLI
jgi:hypothetical protein